MWEIGLISVLEEVRVNDVLVIRKGALALATVTEANPRSVWGAAEN